MKKGKPKLSHGCNLSTRRVIKHPDFGLQAMHPGRGTGRDPVEMTKMASGNSPGKARFYN